MRLRPLGVLTLVGLAPLASSVASCGAPARSVATPRNAPSQAATPPSPDAGRAPSNELAGDAASEVGEPMTAEASDASVDAGAAGVATSAVAGACNEQPPQDFLVRGNFLKGGQKAIERAIQWRTDTYGYFKGFGHAPADAQPPSAFVETTTFMDLPVRMHHKVIPALKCVEETIRRACTDHPYKARALAGIRFRNTYRGGEVTNHIYGIAIDVDPSLNTCCGCVKPWNDAPACKRPAKTEYDRMAMPECWVHAFERYGFYWLGHDVLRDTMHFEFLGDPDHIVKKD
jgi:D-alanyl-D-alanine carboxypeptidase-like protein